MRDLGEFRAHWKPLVACLLGMGSALSINSFIMSNFALYLLEEFGWSRSEWASMGAATAVVMFLMPLAGYLADRYGVRRVASVGMIAFPAANLLYSQMTGDIRVFFAIFLMQTILCCTTTATIYTRLVAEKYDIWRGLALAICASSPSIVGLVGSPLISGFVADHGWRNGFVAVAVFSGICGLIAFLLIPPPRPVEAAVRAKPAAGGVLRRVVRMPSFWVLAAGAFLVSTHHALFTMSLKLVVIEQGLDDAGAATIVSIFAGSAIAGRLLSGLALDFLRPQWVAAVFLGLPTVGLLMIASGNDGWPMLVSAFVLVGLAYGGEGDIVGYLVARIFGIEVFSTVMGFITAAIAAAIMGGSLVLGLLLKGAGSFTPFLLGTAALVLVGSGLMLTLGGVLGGANPPRSRGGGSP